MSGQQTPIMTDKSEASLTKKDDLNDLDSI